MAEREALFSRVAYDRVRDVVELSFGTIELRVPRSMIAELKTLTTIDLGRLEVGNAGLTISQRDRDIDISIAGLVGDCFGKLAAAESGRAGGRKRSPKKAAAARRNGARGGRPRSK